MRWSSEADMKKRDAIVLVTLCGFLVLTAGALRMGGSMRAKLLMCTVNLQKIAQAVAPYADSCDGKMPTLTGPGGTYQRPQWIAAVMDTSTGKTEWQGLGCLFGAGYIADGRQFYCPAAEGSMDEYMAYSNPGPWGSHLDQQAPNLGSPNLWLRLTRGYVYWPLKRNNCTQAEFDAIRFQAGYEAPGFTLRYKVGYPLAAVKYADLGPSRPMMFDFPVHATKASGYTINVAYGDSHVELTGVPRYAATGKYMYPYQQDSGVPTEDRLPGGQPDASKWVQVLMFDYTAALQPQ
jgi:hypothetical protein